MPRRTAQPHRRQPVPPVAHPTRAWLVLIVVGAGIVAYANSLGGVFFLDDFQNIVSNPEIRDVGRLDAILLDGHRPVVNLTLALNYAAGGLQTRGYHIVNIIIHALAGAVLFGVIRRTLLLERFGDRYHTSAPWLAMTVALLWTVHPLQTQSVTYIIQRSEALLGLFFFLTVYCVLRGRAWTVAAIAACWLGMGSKAVMITAPFVVLAYDWVFLAHGIREILSKRWLLYSGLCSAWILLAALGLLKGVFVQPPGSGATVGFGYEGVTPLAYLVTQAGVLVHYLWLSIVPHPLCLDYGWPVAQTAMQMVPAGLVIVVLLALTAWGLWRRRAIGFLGAWFFLILAPTSSFIPIKDIAFEHRMYLPLAAVLTVIVVAVYSLLRWMVNRGVFSTNAARRVGGGLVILVAVVLCGMTMRRNLDYSTEIAMWQDVTEHRPNNARAWNNLGLSLLKAGREDDSLDAFQHAVDADSGYGPANINLAKSLVRQGRITDAIPYYERGVNAERGQAHAHFDLGSAYWHAGQPEKAFARYERGIELSPRNWSYRLVYADKLRQADRASDALEQYREVARLAPADVEARLETARGLGVLGDHDAALATYRSAAALEPAHAGARYELGNLLLRQEQWQAAIDEYDEALRIEPRFLDARCNRAIALLSLDQADEATAEFRAILTMDPRHIVARIRLARTLQSQGRVEEARAELERVLEIDPTNEFARRALQTLPVP